MQFDLGLQGFGILVACAVIFGLAAQIVLGTGNRWMWLIGSVAWFLGGLFISEVTFAGATEADIQPVIDGLAFDESLLGGLVVGLIATLAAWWATGHGPMHRPTRPTPI